MAIFTLKEHDTRPILEVALKNPDGTPHDLTGSTSWKLHIEVSPNVLISRDMVKQGADTAGILRYTWQETDWDTGNLPTGLGPSRTKELRMEYEVIAGTSRLTFPNNTYDKLKILGQLA